jgi:hypothetical protein
VERLVPGGGQLEDVELERDEGAGLPSHVPKSCILR